MHRVRRLTGGAAVTGIAAATLLASTAGAQIIFFDGIPHTPLGTAQVSTATGQLVVSNIGSSGQDGVRVDLGRGHGWGAELDMAAMGGQTGSELTWQIHGNADGNDAIVAQGRMEVLTGGAIGISGSAVSATDIMVEAWGDGRLLCRRTASASSINAVRLLIDPTIFRPIRATWLGPIPGERHWTCDIFWIDPCGVEID